MMNWLLILLQGPFQRLCRAPSNLIEVGSAQDRLWLCSRVSCRQGAAPLSLWPPEGLGHRVLPAAHPGCGGEGKVTPKSWVGLAG